MPALEILSNDKVYTIGLEKTVLPVVPPIKIKVPTTFRAINLEYSKEWLSAIMKLELESQTKVNEVGSPTFNISYLKCL